MLTSSLPVIAHEKRTIWQKWSSQVKFVLPSSQIQSSLIRLNQY